MSVTSRLVFDVTDANTQAASSNVGAWLRAGVDGDLIDSTTGSLHVIVTAALPAGTNNIGDVDVLSVIPGTAANNLGKAEDAAHTTGDVGVFNLAVRSDTAASTGTTDGDYSALITSSTGRLWVSALIDTAIPAGTNNIGDVDVLSILPGTGATNLGKAEDSAHTSGDVGVGMLAVYQATLASSAADNDYGFLKLDADGALWVNTGSAGSDFALANVAIQSTATAVSTLAIDISTPLANRKYVYAYNHGNVELYLGESGVATSDGFPLFPGQSIMLRAGAAVDIEVIGGTGASSESLRVMELS